MSKSIRVAERTYRQIDELKKAGYESITNVAVVAIDRLYQEEIKMKKHELNVPTYANETDTWITTCSCGARWRCTYTDKGLHWEPLNAEARKCPHNQ